LFLAFVSAVIFGFSFLEISDQYFDSLLESETFSLRKEGPEGATFVAFSFKMMKMNMLTLERN
jgi:hypothetical protein